MSKKLSKSCFLVSWKPGAKHTITLNDVNIDQAQPYLFKFAGCHVNSYTTKSDIACHCQTIRTSLPIRPDLLKLNACQGSSDTFNTIKVTQKHLNF